MSFEYAFKRMLVICFLFGSQPAHPEILATSIQSSAKISQPCKLKFGFTEWKPLQYFDANGTPVGIQIDLVNAIMKQMNCEVTFVFGSWTENMQKIESGEIDLTANASPTAEREAFALFSDSYRKDEFTVFVKQEERNQYAFNSIEQLKNSGFRLGLAKDYVYGSEIEAWQMDKTRMNQLSYVDIAEQNIERLFQDEIDGILEDPLVISYRLRSKDLTRRIVPLSIQTFGREVCFIFSKKKINPDFVNQFNQALNITVQSPEQQSIWIKPYH